MKEGSLHKSEPSFFVTIREDLLYYVWANRKYNNLNLKTVTGESLEIIDVGVRNNNAGPDFFNGCVRINGQIWAGNIEMHTHSSEWYMHKHHLDETYDNVILHVVWDDDQEVFDKNQNQLPTLLLKQYVNIELLSSYRKLTEKKNWINCEYGISSVDENLFTIFKERLYIERLEAKSVSIEEKLKEVGNDWEALFYRLLLYAFGLTINSESFEELYRFAPFKVVRKTLSDQTALESLLLGQCNLLNDVGEFNYGNELKASYHYIKSKYSLPDPISKASFFRLRPTSFPTIRLSQLATLYHEHQALFMKCMSANSLDQYYKILNIQASAFWTTHYTFFRSSKASRKQLSKEFVDRLLINVIIPVKYVYFRCLGQDNTDEILSLITELKSEKNRIITHFETLGVESNNALDTQALLRLKKNYCDLQKCLRCSVGNELLNAK